MQDLLKRYRDFVRHGYPTVEIEDVDYEEVQEIPPERLLPRYSETPYCREDRRREALHNNIFKFISGIEKMLVQFEKEYLIFPRNVDKCAYRWEHELADKIWDAFFSLDERIRDALSDFQEASVQPSWMLWECFGMSDDEYAEEMKVQAKKNVLLELQQEFEYAVMSRFSKCSIFQNDLPF